MHIKSKDFSCPLICWTKNSLESTGACFVSSDRTTNDVHIHVCNSGKLVEHQCRSRRPHLLSLSTKSCMLAKCCHYQSSPPVTNYPTCPSILSSKPVSDCNQRKEEKCRREWRSERTKHPIDVPPADLLLRSRRGQFHSKYCEEAARASSSLSAAPRNRRTDRLTRTRAHTHTRAAYLLTQKSIPLKAVPPANELPHSHSPSRPLQLAWKIDLAAGRTPHFIVSYTSGSRIWHAFALLNGKHGKW